MKSLLDGHIILSRSLAELGHYPAIDVCRSVSRQADRLVSPDQRRAQLKVLEWISTRRDSRMLVDAGLYAKGVNLVLDRALERHQDIEGFLQQQGRESLAATMAALIKLANHDGR